jgi:hypothetical protein
MNQMATSGFAEEKLCALNARADARAIEHANDWDEAIDWGVPDYEQPSEWRMTTAPEFD